MSKRKLIILISRNTVMAATIVTSLLSASLSNAAERKLLYKNNDIEFSFSNNDRAVNKKKATQLLGFSSAHTLKEKRKYTDNNGDVTIRYSQMYKGVLVVGDDIIITRKSNNMFKNIHGAALYNITKDLSDVTPKISRYEAIIIAKNNSIKKGSNQEIQYKNEQTQLVIWKDNTETARLAYEISFMIYAEKTSRPYYIIDAKTGEILHQFDNLQYAVAKGPGGNEKTGRHYYENLIVTDNNNGLCSLLNDKVLTTKYLTDEKNPKPHRFNCDENTFRQINGAYSPLNDAHYFGSIVHDMYSDWINTPPLTFQMVLRAHVFIHFGFENAFWDGSSASFGDGRSIFYPLTSLDIVTHEVSHGFTEQNSGLIYEGKSGALNESFSDMAGEAAEYYQEGNNDWMVGYDIVKGDGALRYMDDPTKDGMSIDHQSDYTPELDVHYASGVYNKAFYNLATSPGWNTEKAFKVYARANMHYWTANTDWNEAGCGVLLAAKDLGYDTAAVAISLHEVGIINVCRG